MENGPGIIKTEKTFRRVKGVQRFTFRRCQLSCNFTSVCVGLYTMLPALLLHMCSSQQDGWPSHPFLSMQRHTSRASDRPSRSDLVFIRFSDLPFNPLWRWLVSQWQSAISSCLLCKPPPSCHRRIIFSCAPSKRPQHSLSIQRARRVGRHATGGEAKVEPGRELISRHRRTRNRSVIFDRSVNNQKWDGHPDWGTKSQASWALHVEWIYINRPFYTD